MVKSSGYLVWTAVLIAFSDVGGIIAADMELPAPCVVVCRCQTSHGYLLGLSARLRLVQERLIPAT